MAYLSILSQHFANLSVWTSGELRPISPSYLTAILEFLLTTLVSNSFSHQSAPAEELMRILEGEHEVKRDVTRQVMSWFGEIKDHRWTMDVNATVKEVGLGILRAYKVKNVCSMGNYTSHYVLLG